MSDLNSRVPVVGSRNGERAVLAGTNQPTLSLRYLTSEPQLQSGDILFTSGDGEFFPVGLPVAQITATPDGTLVALPLMQPQQLGAVTIITPISGRKSRAVRNSSMPSTGLMRMSLIIRS